MVRTKYKDFGWDSKMIYWGYLWEELIMEYNKTSFGLELINPNLLIRVIKNQSETKHLTKESINSFRKMLKEFINNDEVVKKEYSLEFTKIETLLNQSKKK